MNNELLSIKIKCRDNAQCLFTGEDIFLDIDITNNQRGVVGFPLEFAQDKGPMVKLIDTRTKAENLLSSHLADWDLQNKFTMIKPGESVTLEWVIKSVELKQFGGPYVDLSAEVTIIEKIQVNDQLVDFRGTDIRHIVSKNKP